MGWLFFYTGKNAGYAFSAQFLSLATTIPPSMRDWYEYEDYLVSHADSENQYTDEKDDEDLPF
jgi:hypothetical protein